MIMLLIGFLIGGLCGIILTGLIGGNDDRER